MEMKLQIGYQQLLELIVQLPTNQFFKLKAELETIKPTPKPKEEPNDFVQFLLNGPVMSDEQYDLFLENRAYFNKWRTN